MRCGFYEAPKPVEVTSVKTVTPIVNTVSAGYEEPTSRKIKHLGYAEDSIVQLYVNMAREISNGDWDFIRTLEAENGQRNPHRQSNVVQNGIREDSHGFCQLHRAWHGAIVDDSRFWDNPKRQLEQCWNKYKNGTRFYGYDVRHKVKDRFVLSN